MSTRAGRYPSLFYLSILIYSGRANSSREATLAQSISILHPVLGGGQKCSGGPAHWLGATALPRDIIVYRRNISAINQSRAARTPIKPRRKDGAPENEAPAVTAQAIRLARVLLYCAHSRNDQHRTNRALTRAAASIFVIASLVSSHLLRCYLEMRLEKGKGTLF